MDAFCCPQCAHPLSAVDDLGRTAILCRICGRLIVLSSLTPPKRTQTSVLAILTAPTLWPPEDRTELQGSSERPADLNETQLWKSSVALSAHPSLPPSGEIPVQVGILNPPEGADEIGRLGPYRILKILGAGGMGVVFQGHDPVLKRAVAIKAMLPTVAANASNRERFLREAQTAAALENDHIVPIYQVGEDRGIPYLVMRLLQGETLEDRLRRQRPLPMPETLRIVRETAEGLAAAHAHGLIHRDVKPANIWLEAPRGRVLILDFGLARATQDDSGLTQAGVVIGTPAFMSPEQSRGKAVDHRGDLFSLGCVLYQMCTGRLPFHGTDTISRLLALSVDEPPPVRELNAEVPESLADLTAQLLVKNPLHRFPSASGVVEAVEVIENTFGFWGAPKHSSGAASHSLPAASDLFRLEDAEAALEEEDARTSPGVDAEEQPVKDWVDEVAHQTLGHYEVGRLLGRGFHGVVFRARDLRESHDAALKVLDPTFPGNKAEAQRFIRAMRPLLKLRHPNAVGLLAAGKTGRYCWMAWEYVEGESLTTRIQRLRNGSQKIDWRRALRVGIHVARALEFAGQSRLVHHNVTPENILWDGAKKVAKLGDMMFRRAMEGSELHEAVAEEKRTGELAYLAPEQVEGSVDDEISELYNLGAVMYALLTGRPPFEGASPKETIKLICEGEIAKPRKQQKAIPADFEWVVLTALSKGRQYRFQTATELLVHLERTAIEQGIVV
jgi:serine/threonine protein kinase